MVKMVDVLRLGTSHWDGTVSMRGSLGKIPKAGTASKANDRTAGTMNIMADQLHILERGSCMARS